jgi:hypothetical protein
MSKRLHVKYQIFLSDFNDTWIFQQIFEKVSNIRFHLNPYSGSRVVPCGHTDIKLMVAFRNFANAPKKPTLTAIVYSFPIHSRTTHRRGSRHRILHRCQVNLRLILQRCWYLRLHTVAWWDCSKINVEGKSRERSQVSRCSALDSNWTPPEYKAWANLLGGCHAGGADNMEQKFLKQGTSNGTMTVPHFRSPCYRLLVGHTRTRMR